MKILILAGGFAKRMGKLGENTQKSMLPVAGKPVIEHILESIERTGASEVFVSTNKRFEGNFQNLISRWEPRIRVNLIVEPSMEEGQKLGSVGALDFFIKTMAVDDDIFEINGDNIFRSDLSKLMDFHQEKGTLVFGVYDTKSIEEARKMGVVSCDCTGKILDFQEKPENPKGTLVSTGIYIFPKALIPAVGDYITEGNNKDRMGDFLAWLMGRHNLHAIEIGDRWFDIGTPETYRRAEEEFRES
jgi:glucose-1-phosphate thymidylyltransferase